MDITLERLVGCFREVFPSLADVSLDPGTTLGQIEEWDSMTAVGLMTLLETVFNVELFSNGISFTEDVTLQDVLATLQELDRARNMT